MFVQLLAQSPLLCQCSSGWYFIILKTPVALMASFWVAHWWRRNSLVCILSLTYSFSSSFINTIFHLHDYQDDYYCLHYINIPHIKFTHSWTGFQDPWSSTGSSLYAICRRLFLECKSAHRRKNIAASALPKTRPWYFCHLDSWLLFSCTTT